MNGGSLLILDARSKEQQEAVAGDRTLKIAGFDMDGTWIETKSGKRFAKDVDDWKWLHPTLVKAKLEELVKAGFEIVLFSNQNGIAKGNVTAKEVKKKVETIVTKLNLPVLALLATQNDLMRKPRLGGWQEMLKILGVKSPNQQVDMTESFYCGDAAGRPKITGRNKDFAVTDYKFALNIGVKFHTPEDLFLKSKQRIHTHTDMWEIGFDPRSLCDFKLGLLDPPTTEMTKPDQEIIVLVGSPASGKSFFSKTHFSSYTIVNQDELGTLTNCKKKCMEALARKKSVLVDSTNRDQRARSEWISIAKQQNLPIRCFEMDVPKPLAMHLNTYRSVTEDKKIPDIAIHTFYKNFVPPQITEGFTEIVKVRFQIQQGQLSPEKYKLLCSFL
uniref:Polynucleotide kinase 3'-phosphatase n=1 Tax=Globisporangium ultimum (strain ATCC 200006 / CBS 805.95 / DAOM BR144) TaxID=431595 RepID=K3W6J2_GLOUD